MSASDSWALEDRVPSHFCGRARRGEHGKQIDHSAMLRLCGFIYESAGSWGSSEGV